MKSLRRGNEDSLSVQPFSETNEPFVWHIAYPAMSSVTVALHSSAASHLDSPVLIYESRVLCFPENLSMTVPPRRARRSRQVFERRKEVRIDENLERDPGAQARRKDADEDARQLGLVVHFSNGRRQEKRSGEDPLDWCYTEIHDCSDLQDNECGAGDGWRWQRGETG